MGVATTILVVDDELEMRRYLSDRLACDGYAVSVARDGAMALRLLSSETTRPDLILLDLDMPNLGGMAVLKQIRATAETCHTPTLVLSGHTESREVVACLDGGANDFVAKPVDYRELLARIRSQLRRAEAEARWRADSCTDVLTKLLNRRAFVKQLSGAINRASRAPSPLSVVFLDLDDFKQVNDRYGHAMGDHVLEHVAEGIAGSLRAGDIAGRWGGDEFVLGLPGTEVSGAGDVLARIRQTVEQRTRGKDFGPVGVSAGIAALYRDVNPDEEFSATKLIRAADCGMYRNKASRSREHRIVRRATKIGGPRSGNARGQ